MACGVEAYRSQPLSLGYGSTFVEFDQEHRDQCGFHSKTTNPSRFTVPSGYAGWYVAWGGARYEEDTYGFTRTIAIFLNHDTNIANHHHTANDGERFIDVCTPKYLNAGDYVELVLGHDWAGHTINAEVASQYSVEFRMVRV